MKKIAAILIAVCLFSMSVSVRAERIVGGENPALADGALDIPAEAGASSNIQVSVTDVASRYAVDVTFPDLSISFGEMTWNVNTLSYDMMRESPNDVGIFEIDVANHSDKPVLVWGNVEKTDPMDGISMSSSVTFDSRQRIPEVKPQAAGPQVFSLEITVKPVTDWESVVSYLLENQMAGNAGSTYLIGTVSVFVSKVY